MVRIMRIALAILVAWSGVAQRGGPHYYRIQAPTFLIEYDNTQNDANHIHTVWRDLTNDWGEDLRKQHYNTSNYSRAAGLRPFSLPYLSELGLSWRHR